MPITISEAEKAAVMSYFDHPIAYTSWKICAYLHENRLPDGSKLTRVKYNLHERQIPRYFIIPSGSNGQTISFPLTSMAESDTGAHSATLLNKKLFFHQNKDDLPRIIPETFSDSSDEDLEEYDNQSHSDCLKLKHKEFFLLLNSKPNYIHQRVENDEIITRVKYAVDQDNRLFFLKSRLNNDCSTDHEPSKYAPRLYVRPSIFRLKVERFADINYELDAENLKGSLVNQQPIERLQSSAESCDFFANHAESASDCMPNRKESSFTPQKISVHHSLFKPNYRLKRIDMMVDCGQNLDCFLSDHLISSHQLDQMAAEILRQYLLLNRAAIVHADIKAANICIKSTLNSENPFQITFIDFDDAFRSYQRTGVRYGTPGYMAPEFFESHEAFDHQLSNREVSNFQYLATLKPNYPSFFSQETDVFALGVVLVKDLLLKQGSHFFELATRMLATNPSDRPNAPIITEFLLSKSHDLPRNLP